MAKKGEKARKTEIVATEKTVWYRNPEYAVIAVLVAACAIIYAQTAGFDFINLDDDLTILNNPAIHQGLTWDSIRWALTSLYGANWLPVTWFSHELDIQLFGLTAGGPHVVNALFHLANSIVLFYLIRTLTGRLWESAAVAVIFAIHPAHVESVAWVSERKDSLSTLFWLFSTFMYVKYVRKTSNKNYYFASVALLGMGLAAKPFLVTMPFTLILLDYWPLQRFNKWNANELTPLVKEKAPYFILVAIASAITVIAQSKGGAVQSTDIISLSDRYQNVIVSYAKYVAMLFYPANLAIWYPFERNLGVATVLLSAVALILVSLIAIKQMRERKYFFVGWLWFLGTLVPVIGFLQVGRQALADRYTYVSYIGLSIAVVWLAAEAARRFNVPKAAVAGISLAAMAALTVVSVQQVSFWKNSETIALRALAVTRNNYLIESNYCDYLRTVNRLDEGIVQCQLAIEHDPTLVIAYNNLGSIQLKQSKFAEARQNFEKAIEIDPNSYLALGNMARVETNAQNADKALDYFSHAIASDNVGFFDASKRVEAYSAIGSLAIRQKRYDIAANCFKQALDAAPNNTDLILPLAIAYRMTGKSDQALQLLQDLIRRNPNSADAYNTLGTIYAEQNRKTEAIEQFQRALQIKPDLASAQMNLKKIME